MRLAMILAANLAMTACASAPPPAPPPPQPAPPPPAPPPLPAPPATHWQDRPATPGEWTLRQDAQGSAALFGQAGADADFSIRCVAATRQIVLSRAGALAKNGSGQMIVSATDAVKTYATTGNGQVPPTVSAQTLATDPQLDAIAFSRGRFLVSVSGAPDLVLPTGPEFARVIEDCRSPAGANGAAATLPM